MMMIIIINEYNHDNDSNIHISNYTMDIVVKFERKQQLHQRLVEPIQKQAKNKVPTKKLSHKTTGVNKQAVTHFTLN